MNRNTFTRDGVELSYLDSGPGGTPIIALHAFWMESGTFTAFADAVEPNWRVIAPDLRGHGHSDKPADLSWDAFIVDLAALIDHLGIEEPVVLLGNSLGGSVSFRFAARHPTRVRAMIIEESAAAENANIDFIREWSGIYPSRQALADKIGERLAWSVEPSFRQTENGWTLAFSPDQLADARTALNGDFWSDWLASDCPVLVMRGLSSKAIDGEILERMAVLRPNTTLQRFEAGHVIHHELPGPYAEGVFKFLREHD